jgi:hypothetical protein
MRSSGLLFSFPSKEHIPAARTISQTAHFFGKKAQRPGRIIGAEVGLFCKYYEKLRSKISRNLSCAARNHSVKK